MQATSNIEFTHEELLSEAERREANRAQLTNARFEKQTAFASDPSHFKAALCGRRAGKTRELIYQLRESMDNHPGDTNVFVERTRPAAKNKLWRPFKRLNDEMGWCLDFVESELRISHNNGSELIIVGSDTWKEIDKIRGLERLRLSCIDECGAQKPSNLQYLVEDVLEPGLMDVNGTMLLSGTPGLALTGYWYEITGQIPPKPGWSTHRWNVYDNPYLDGDNFIRALLERRQWDTDNAVFQREYIGRWIKDLSRLIFAFGTHNIISALPTIGPGWTFILSLDFGTAAATSFVVLGYPPFGRNVYIFRSYKEVGLAPTEVADRVRDLVTEYRPSKIIGDLHGLGKAYAQEMVRRHGIVIQAADKSKKRSVIEYVSDGFRTGQILSYAGNKTLHTELETLLWDEEHQDIADGQDDHESEALVYGFAECQVYSNDLLPPDDHKYKEIPEGYPQRREEEKPFWYEEEW